jgi:hypothetical protein
MPWPWFHGIGATLAMANVALVRLKEQRESHEVTKEIKIDTSDLSAISGDLFQT